VAFIAYADFIGVANIIGGKVYKDKNGVKGLLSEGIEYVIPQQEGHKADEKVLLVVRPEKVEIGKKAIECDNSFRAEVTNVLYKGSCSEVYVSLSNGQELRIRVENKSILQDEFSKDAISIGWNKEDTVVLKKSVSV
jgi:ABC-type Fe3+/spermidine/putrescine transport system ATPase subunit